MAFDLIDYTKKLMEELGSKDAYITQVYIAYKVVLYYENNIGEITDDIKPTLINIIDEIYDIYSSMDELELIDSLVSNKLNSL